MMAPEELRAHLAQQAASEIPTSEIAGPAKGVGFGALFDLCLAAMRADGRAIMVCADVRKLPGAPECCSSCHEEWAGGYCDEDYREPDDVIPAPSIFCCAVRRWVKAYFANPKDEPRRP